MFFIRSEHFLYSSSFFRYCIGTLPDRLMVGHMTLNHVILVRAQVWQHMYFLYLMLCRDNSIYTGITTDLERRFKEHQNGEGSKYVRARGAKKILYTERFRSRS